RSSHRKSGAAVPARRTALRCPRRDRSRSVRYAPARAARRSDQRASQNCGAAASRAAAAGPGAPAAPGDRAAPRRRSPWPRLATAPPTRGFVLPSRGVEAWRGSPRQRRQAYRAWQSERLDRLQHLGDVAGHLDLVPHIAHDALIVDQEGAAVDAHVLASVHAFLDPDPVSLADLAILVGSK